MVPHVVLFCVLSVGLSRTSYLVVLYCIVHICCYEKSIKHFILILFALIIINVFLYVLWTGTFSSHLSVIQGPNSSPRSPRMALQPAKPHGKVFQVQTVSIALNCVRNVFVRGNSMAKQGCV